ncbi:hypothetical protein SAMN04515620_1711, partial [Collimonas sp. OK607]
MGSETHANYFQNTYQGKSYESLLHSLIPYFHSKRLPCTVWTRPAEFRMIESNDAKPNRDFHLF